MIYISQFNLFIDSDKRKEQWQEWSNLLSINNLGRKIDRLWLLIENDIAFIKSTKNKNNDLKGKKEGYISKIFRKKEVKKEAEINAADK